MPNKQQSFIEGLKEGYEVAKKPMAYIIMFSAILLQVMPKELIPKPYQGITYAAMLIILCIILMQMLFAIYDNSTKDKKRLNVIKSSDLHNSILAITHKEKNVSIKYIGVAGRIGWTNVLAKLIDENDPDSLVANRTKFKIDVALFKNEHQYDMDKYKGVEDISSNIINANTFLETDTKIGSKINLYRYTYMPNVLGFLINENYLFTTNAFWEKYHGKMTLRAGENDYFVYNKNDDFGGQEVIRHFVGWFNYIVREDADKAEKESTEDS